MKRTIQTTIQAMTLAISGLALTGCSTFNFLYSLANGPEDLAKDVDISGDWKSAKKETLRFEKRAGGSYALLVLDKDETSFDADLVRVSNYLFLDISTKEEGTSLRGHWYAQVRLQGDRLELSSMDNAWLEKKVRDERALPYELPCTGKERRCYVVTAQPADLQAFLMRHAQDPKAFKEWDTFTNSSPRE